MSTELERIKEVLEEEGGCLHRDVLEEITGQRYPASQTGEPLACVYCNAPWSPEMLDYLELSGYCPTCADAENVTDIFCSACGRLVYRK